MVSFERIFNAIQTIEPPAPDEKKKRKEKTRCLNPAMGQNICYSTSHSQESITNHTRRNLIQLINTFQHVHVEIYIHFKEMRH